MEPNDDLRLKRLLREWQVPDAPDTLEPRVLRRARPWWRILLSSRIRIPVPVAVVFAVAMIWLAVLVAQDRLSFSERTGADPGLRGFQPVSSINVRIERSGHATP